MRHVGAREQAELPGHWFGPPREWKPSVPIPEGPVIGLDPGPLLAPIEREAETLRRLREERARIAALPGVSSELAERERRTRDAIERLDGMALALKAAGPGDWRHQQEAAALARERQAREDELQWILEQKRIVADLGAQLARLDAEIAASVRRGQGATQRARSQLQRELARVEKLGKDVASALADQRKGLEWHGMYVAICANNRHHVEVARRSLRQFGWLSPNRDEVQADLDSKEQEIQRVCPAHEAGYRQCAETVARLERMTGEVAHWQTRVGQLIAQIAPPGTESRAGGTVADIREQAVVPIQFVPRPAGPGPVELGKLHAALGAKKSALEAARAYKERLFAELEERRQDRTTDVRQLQDLQLRTLAASQRIEVALRAVQEEIRGQRELVVARLGHLAAEIRDLEMSTGPARSEGRELGVNLARLDARLVEAKAEREALLAYLAELEPERGGR